MDLYKQQQFGFFLQTATERYVARLEERFRGAEAARQMIAEDPNGEGREVGVLSRDGTGWDCVRFKHKPGWLSSPFSPRPPP